MIINTKLFYLLYENPFKTMRKLKGVFKPLKCRFYYGIGPEMWCSKPHFIHLVFHDVMWKDKFETPRHEDSPYIWLHFFKWDFIWYWKLPKGFNGYDMDYWEQALWYLYYASYNPEKKGYDELSVERAEKTWPWQNFDGTSNWNKDFLL